MRKDKKKFAMEKRPTFKEIVGRMKSTFVCMYFEDEENSLCSGLSESAAVTAAMNLYGDFPVDRMTVGNNILHLFLEKEPCKKDLDNHGVLTVSQVADIAFTRTLYVYPPEEGDRRYGGLRGEPLAEREISECGKFNVGAIVVQNYRLNLMVDNTIKG